MNLQDLKKNQNSKVHFIGVGGIGMSALAFILCDEKISVQGSDLAKNYLTPKLIDKGVDYFIGQNKDNINDDVVLVVKTSIIKDDNPEILAAQQKNIPIITRANLLALIIAEKKGITIAGTHGKTSTTAITSLVLEAGDLDPTVINGGVIHYFGSNSKSGKGDYLIAESDESDASFVELPTLIGAITNIEAEHLDHPAYGGDFEVQKSYFEKYVEQIPEHGACVLCVDDQETLNLYNKFKNKKKNLITYSIDENNKDADLVAKNIKMNYQGLSFDVSFKNGRQIQDIKIPTFGLHNASNSLISIAIADFLKIPDYKIKAGLSEFNGVKRRFTKVGDYNGVTIIDDYAHHPTEIKAVLDTAKQLTKGKVFAVFQPHKYTRLRDAFDGFCNAFADSDFAIIADIFAAGQDPIPGALQDDLVIGVEKTGHKNVIKLASEKDLGKVLKTRVRAGDIVMCLGAGSITYWAADLEEQLRKA